MSHKKIYRLQPSGPSPNTGRGRDRGNGGGYSLSAESRGNGQGLVTLCYVAKGSGEVRSHVVSRESKWRGKGNVLSHTLDLGCKHKVRIQVPPQCSIYSHRCIPNKDTMISTCLVMITSHKECKELKRVSTKWACLN